MFDDDQELDAALSHALNAYGERAAGDRSSSWPRIRAAMHAPARGRLRRLPRFWLVPAIILPLIATAGTALAIYSHTSPIVWIFDHPGASGRGQTVHVYYPPPRPVSLHEGEVLLGDPLPQIQDLARVTLRSVTFQGATSRTKADAAPSDEGSVALVYDVEGQTVSLREYNSGRGPLISKLKGSNVSAGAGETLSVITVDGGSYQIEQNTRSQVLFVEWKTLPGVLIVMNGGGQVSTPLLLSFVESLLPHIH